MKILTFIEILKKILENNFFVEKNRKISRKCFFRRCYYTIQKAIQENEGNVKKRNKS